MTDGNNHQNNSTVMRSCFEASFSSLFDNGDIGPRISSLVLPVFQVAYQWGPQHVSKLVRDVDSARRSGDLSYFGGCLVLVERERRIYCCCSLVDQNPNYYIIDGKQRITTITMILSVCRYYDPENESIYTNWLARAKPYRLWLDRDNNQIGNDRPFEDYILTPRGIRALFDEDRDIAYSQYVAELRKNAICIMKFLQELGQENSLEFARYMVQQCKFIIIIVPNIELALKMSCSLSCSFNVSSGVQSPALEYHRARFYERLVRNMNEWHAQLALRDWNQIEANLGGAESMQQFLIHFCCVQLYIGIYEDRPRIDYIIDVFNREESTRETAIQRILYRYFYSVRGERIIGEVMKFSKIYREIVETQMAGNNRYSYPLDLLRYMTKQLLQRNSTHYNLWITIALKAASIHPIENSGTFWRKLEKLFAYFISAKTSVEIVARSCDQILRQIHQLRNKHLPEMYRWNQLNLETRQVSRFRSLIQGNIYLKNPSAARYLMLNIEHRRSQGRLLNTLAIDEIATTVEQICPLTPQQGSNWLREPWSEELRHFWLHKIGNLALLEKSHNTEMSNYAWCVKSEVYRYNRRGQPSSFLYTRELCENSDWTPDLCNARQRQLVGQLFKIYGLSDGGHTIDGDGEDDDSGGDHDHLNEDEDGNEDDDDESENLLANQNAVFVQQAIEILMQIKTEMNLGNRDVLTISKQLQNEHLAAMFIGFDDSTRKYWLRHELGLTSDGEDNAQPDSSLEAFGDRHIKLLWSLGEIFDISHEIAEVLEQDSKSLAGSNGATASGAKVGPVDRRRNHNTSEDTQFGPSNRRFKQLVVSKNPLPQALGKRKRSLDNISTTNNPTPEIMDFASNDQHVLDTSRPSALPGEDDVISPSSSMQPLSASMEEMPGEYFNLASAASNGVNIPTDPEQPTSGKSDQIIDNDDTENNRNSAILENSAIDNNTAEFEPVDTGDNNTVEIWGSVFKDDSYSEWLKSDMTSIVFKYHPGGQRGRIEPILRPNHLIVFFLKEGNTLKVMNVAIVETGQIIEQTDSEGAKTFHVAVQPLLKVRVTSTLLIMPYFTSTVHHDYIFKPMNKNPKHTVTPIKKLTDERNTPLTHVRIFGKTLVQDFLQDVLENNIEKDNEVHRHIKELINTIDEE